MKNLEFDVIVAANGESRLRSEQLFIMLSSETA
jgi:hypothetical protein